MEGAIAGALKLAYHPVALVRTDEKPDGALQCKENFREALKQQLMPAS